MIPHQWRAQPSSTQDSEAIANRPHTTARTTTSRPVQRLQHLGKASSKGRSWCCGLLHRGPKQSFGNPNFTAASLMRHPLAGRKCSRDHLVLRLTDKIMRQRQLLKLRFFAVCRHEEVGRITRHCGSLKYRGASELLHKSPVGQRSKSDIFV